MFTNIFKRLIAIILNPADTWRELKGQEKEQDMILSQFVYPLIGMIALAAFLGIFFTRKVFDIEIALKITLRTVIAVAGGFFISAYFLNEIRKSVFNQPKVIELCRCFVGYASSLMFVLYIITSLLPEFFFLKIFVLYTVYIIWESAVIFMQVSEEKRLKFTLIASFIVILTPIIIDQALRIFMPGFRI